jgi:hypothetical protein
MIGSELLTASGLLLNVLGCPQFDYRTCHAKIKILFRDFYVNV